ncbi:MAG: SGNH/GDSL hydrolase family protein [Anaerolineae bacterium]|jgi:lysophospholipase L1-like esterase
MTKTVLCFGDSNTWGWDPATQERFPETVRWAGVCKHVLGSQYRIIEEGLNGRTTVWDDPIEGCKSGKTYLVPCLESHRPLDLVIIMLGTNDLKNRFSVSAYDIADSAGALVDIVQRSEAGRGGRAPRVLLVAPPPLGRLTDFAGMYIGAPEKSRNFSQQFRRVAEEFGCPLMDASEVVVSSDVDGVHLEASEHQKLGEAIAAVIQSILD